MSRLHKAIAILHIIHNGLAKKWLSITVALEFDPTIQHLY